MTIVPPPVTGEATVFLATRDLGRKQVFRLRLRSLQPACIGRLRHVWTAPARTVPWSTWLNQDNVRGNMAEDHALLEWARRRLISLESLSTPTRISKGMAS